MEVLILSALISLPSRYSQSASAAPVSIDIFQPNVLVDKRSFEVQATGSSHYDITHEYELLGYCKKPPLCPPSRLASSAWRKGAAGISIIFELQVVLASASGPLSASGQATAFLYCVMS